MQQIIQPAVRTAPIPIRICICTHILYLNANKRMHMHTYTHTHTHTHAYTHTCAGDGGRTLTHTHTHTCTGDGGDRYGGRRRGGRQAHVVSRPWGCRHQRGHGGHQTPASCSVCVFFPQGLCGCGWRGVGVCCCVGAVWVAFIEKFKWCACCQVMK